MRSTIRSSVSNRLATSAVQLAHLLRTPIHAASARIAILCLLGALGRAQGKEVLYALRFSSGIQLVTVDLPTGLIARSVYLTPTWTAQSALGWNGTRLVVQGNTNQFADRLIRCHPADGSTAHLGSIGWPWYIAAQDVDSSVGLMRVVVLDWFSNTDYYVGTINAITGALVLGPKITPAGSWEAMAIDGSGAAILSQGSGQLFSLDTSSGVAAFLGSTTVANAFCSELAFDAAGQLWGAFRDAVNGANSGIYRLDLIALTATRISPTPALYYGIAFGQETAPQSYCAAKPNSLSCVPTIWALGLASPLARNGFTIGADYIANNKTGVLLYSTAGRAAIPFQGGLLCLQPPIGRTSSASSGGAPPPAHNCSGRWSIDWNQFVWDRFGGPQLGPTTNASPALLTPGTTIQCQWWGRDPGFAPPNNSTLTDGLEFTTSP